MYKQKWIGKWLKIVLEIKIARIERITYLVSTTNSTSVCYQYAKPRGIVYHMHYQPYCRSQQNWRIHCQPMYCPPMDPTENRRAFDLVFSLSFCVCVWGWVGNLINNIMWNILVMVVAVLAVVAVVSFEFLVVMLDLVILVSVADSFLLIGWIRWRFGQPWLEHVI